MSCPQCAAELAPGVRFCPRCGAEAAVPCPSCGAPAAPDVRFCTRCGAERTATDAPEAAREPPTQAMPPVAAQTTQTPAPGAQRPPPVTEAPAPSSANVAARPRRPSLGTPPANESWWRNPIVLVAAAVTLLGGGGGVATWRILAAGEEAAPVVSKVTHLATPPTASITTAAPGGSDAELATAVGEVDRLLTKSHAGRIAVAQQHDFAAALRNRRALLAALDRLDLPAGAASLAPSVALLRAVLTASERADAAHLACGCETKLPSDVAADRLKRRFADRFDPFARRYLGHPIDPQQI
jgi:double zinc ribbon protein